MIGRGVEATRVTVVTAGDVGIVNALNAGGSGCTGLLLRDFTLDRNVTANTSGTGIDFIIRCDEAVLDNLRIINQYTGLRTGGTNESYVNKVVSKFNYDSGFIITNSTDVPAAQYKFTDCLADGNNAWGYLITPTKTNDSMYLSTMVDCSTFANTSGGLAISGAATQPIYSLRMVGCFMGADDTNAIIYMDSHGDFHQVLDCFFELAGQESTGRNYGTAAKNQGDGMLISANNGTVTIGNTTIYQCARHGILSETPVLHINGLRSDDHGQDGLGSAAGLYVNDGQAYVTNPMMTSNNYGIYSNNKIVRAYGGRVWSNSNSNLGGTYPAGSDTTTIRTS